MGVRLLLEDALITRCGKVRGIRDPSDPAFPRVVLVERRELAGDELRDPPEGVGEERVEVEDGITLPEEFVQPPEVGRLQPRHCPLRPMAESHTGMYVWTLGGNHADVNRKREGMAMKLTTGFAPKSLRLMAVAGILGLALASLTACAFLPPFDPTTRTATYLDRRDYDYFLRLKEDLEARIPWERDPDMRVRLQRQLEFAERYLKQWREAWEWRYGDPEAPAPGGPAGPGDAGGGVR